jgi:hypothetical protein
MTPHTSDNAVELAARLRSSAKAFRENTVYGQDGDPLRLGVQADECDEAADFIESHCTPAPTMEMDGLYARLAELLAKATPGPWWDAGWPYSGQIHGGMDGDADDEGRHVISSDTVADFSDGARTYENLELVVAAINALPQLLTDLTIYKDRVEQAGSIADRLLALIGFHRDDLSPGAVKGLQKLVNDLRTPALSPDHSGDIPI